MVTTSNIYLITNIINNKKYVGQTCNINERWNRHKLDYKRLTSKYLYRAMNKYGFENFVFEILEENIHISEINEREIYWIGKLNTKVPNGYNMTDGGEGSINRVITDETRLKMSKSQKGRKTSEETKIKLSIAHKNRYKDESERKKMSHSHKNNSKLIEKATSTIRKVNESMSKEERMRNLEIAVSKRSKSVLAKSLTDDSALEFNSTREASRWIRENTDFAKACHTNISKACRGKIDYVYGYKWVYKESEQIEGATTIPNGSTLENELPAEVPSILI